MQDYVTSLSLHEMAVSFQGRLPDSPPQWKLQANTVIGSASPDFSSKRDAALRAFVNISHTKVSCYSPELRSNRDEDDLPLTSVNHVLLA